MTFDSMPSSSDPVETPTASSDLRQPLREHTRLWIGLGICGMMLIFGLPITKQRFSGVIENAQAIEATKVEVLPVETLTIQPVASYKVARAYTGKIAAQRSSDLGFERSGQLVEVLVRVRSPLKRICDTTV
jgi:multidrug efflux pump subunit AcrA (membrane-fusion protein)